MELPISFEVWIAMQKHFQKIIFVLDYCTRLFENKG